MQNDLLGFVKKSGLRGGGKSRIAKEDLSKLY
jgi:hypothetical protein